MKTHSRAMRIDVLGTVGLAGLLLPVVAHAGIVLLAATANPDTKPEVRLRWTVTGSDWLPDGGFNLYRVENGARTKLNTAPIKPVDPNATPVIKLGARPGTAGLTVNLKDLLTRAGTRPAGLQERDLILIRPKTARPPSSAPVFQSMKTAFKAFYELKGPTLSEDQINQKVSSLPTVRAYFSRIRGEGKTPLLLPKLTPLTEADRFLQARSALLLHAMIHPEVAQAVGLSYTDAAVQKGTHYQYALRAIKGGAEAAADDATVDITVGADPQPPAPTGFDALQRSPMMVDLRWDRLSDDATDPLAESRFGLVTYNLYRTNPGASEAVQLNKIPISIANMQGPNGLVEPVAFYSDRLVPVGEVKYQLVMVDSFGRASPPATLPFTMEEWHAPLAPARVIATYANGKTTVMWTPAADDPITVPKVDVGKPIRYHIYRVDVEQQPITPQLLSTEPFEGIFTPGKAQSIRTVLNLIPAAHSVYMAATTGTPHPLHKALFVDRKAGARGALREDMSADQLITASQSVPNMVALAKQLQTQLDAGFLTFTDDAPVKDHYYRYLVAAFYPSSLKESLPAMSARVGIPLDTPPAVPTGLDGKFGPPVMHMLDASIPPSTSSPGSNTGMRLARMTYAPKNMKSIFSDTERKSILGNLHFGGTPPNVAGTLTLQWNPVAATKPVTYRIYRANATSYFGQSPVYRTRYARSFGVKSGAGTEIQANANSANTSLGDLAGMARSGAVAVMFPPAYTLVGSVVDNDPKGGPVTFDQDMPHSAAQYYQFMVVAVNRWGFAGAGASKLIRIPATSPPTAPGLKEVHADLGGAVDIAVNPPPASEEVVKYHILRKQIFLYVTATSNGKSFTPGQLTAAAQNTSMHGIVKGGAFTALKEQRLSTPPLPPGLGQNRAFNGPAPVRTEAAGPDSRTPFVEVEAPAKVEQKFGSIALNAHGTVNDMVGAGASRFGAVRHEGAATILAKGLASGHLTSDQLSLLAIDNWQEVGVVSVPASTGHQLGDPLTYQDTTGTPQVEYLYQAIAEDSDGLKSIPSSVMDATPLKVKCDPPGKLTVTSPADAAHPNAASLSWGPSPAPGLLGYIVRRSAATNGAASGPDLQLSGMLQTGATSFTDYSALAGHNYIYEVVALDNSGNLSDPSSAPLTRP